MAALPGGTDVAITHKFVSGKADGPDPTLVQPSKWNQDENLGSGADGQKIARDSGQADGGSWVNYESASFTNSTGGAAAVGDVVAVSVAADNAVVLDDTVSSVKKFAVALQTPANAAVGAYGYAGPIPGVKAQGAIAAGQYVRKSATTKAVEDAGVTLGSATPPPAGALGFATSAAAAGFVNVFWFLETVPSAAAGAVYTDNLTGLTLSNNGADATNDIDIAVGAAASDAATIANRVLMSLTSAFTKQLDTAWAVGGGTVGMLATGAGVTNTTYHIFLIRRPDTGVVDIAADTSVTGANIATNTNANYTQIRRIGSIIREGGVNVAFTQFGDEFMRSSPTLDVDTTNPGTSAVTATSLVPAGLVVLAILNVFLRNGTSSGVLLYISPLAVTDQAPSATAAPLGSLGSDTVGGLTSFADQVRVLTNTSRQFRYRMSASGAADIVRIATLGWLDRRGRG